MGRKEGKREGRKERRKEGREKETRQREYNQRTQRDNNKGERKGMETGIGIADVGEGKEGRVGGRRRGGGSREGRKDGREGGKEGGSCSRDSRKRKMQWASVCLETWLLAECQEYKGVQRKDRQ